jgi:opacity protein-like surface antigen
MQFGLHAKYFLPLTGSPVHPYLVAGAGMYQAKVEFSAGTYSESADDTDMGFRGGVGANFTVNPMFGIGAEADYHMVQTEGESTTFYGLKAGLVFNLGAK